MLPRACQGVHAAHPVRPSVAIGTEVVRSIPIRNRVLIALQGCKGFSPVPVSVAEEPRSIGWRRLPTCLRAESRECLVEPLERIPGASGVADGDAQVDVIAAKSHP